MEDKSVLPNLGLFDPNTTSPSFVQERELSREEYTAYKAASGLLIGWLDNQQNFQAVLDSFVGYMNTTMDAEEEVRHAGYLSQSLRVKRDVNRSLSDFLRAVRSFLDYSKKILVDKYGADSPQVQRFVKATHEVYDARFSYRLLDQLRNYTQHVGEAIQHLSYGTRAVDLETRTSESYLDVSLDRNMLLNWSKLKGSVRKELEGMPLKIPLTSQVQEVTGCVKYLNSVVIVQQLDDLVDAARHITALVQPLLSKPGTPTVYHFDVRHSLGDQPFDFDLKREYIPLDLARFVLETYNQTSKPH